ncbi:hypothetical protein FRC05_001020 [Tulasnella sp. 425]|nr:hypothetical protein FRC05_001020 [Tulasnella sp. 425]
MDFSTTTTTTTTMGKTLTTPTTTKSSTTTTKSSTTTTTTKFSTTTTTTSATPSATTKTKNFKLFGAIPSVLGTDYTWPAPSSIDYFVGKGFNAFRVPFTMERISPNSITGSFDATYLASLKSSTNVLTHSQIVPHINCKGAYAAIDPRNSLRLNGTIITDSAAGRTSPASSQATLMSYLVCVLPRHHSSALSLRPLSIYQDLQNEPWGIDAPVVASLMQSDVNGILSTGATNLILVEGTSWTGAWSWTSSGNAAAFTGFTDPVNNFVIGETTSKQSNNNFKGFIGEIGGGSNDVCISAIQSALTAMQTADSPWIDALWWAAGSWRGDYFLSMYVLRTPSGPAVARILPEALEPYLPVTAL